jgi:hypothetical protein
MKNLMAKFQNKEFVQNLLIEVIGDGLMISLGLVAGYYVKIFIIG